MKSQIVFFRFYEQNVPGFFGSSELEIQILEEIGIDTLAGQRFELSFGRISFWFGIVGSDSSAMFAKGMVFGDQLFGRAFSIGELQGRFSLTGATLNATEETTSESEISIDETPSGPEPPADSPEPPSAPEVPNEPPAPTDPGSETPFNENPLPDTPTEIDGLPLPAEIFRSNKIRRIR